MSDIIQSTTQQFLDIYDITNNFVIMKNGTVSTILTVDAMNFGLLAEEEQDAIMYAYAGLLNSLNYPIQIIINSQTKDVTTYLKLLQEQELEAENETMRRRIRMYREFVGNLIHERNVLDKKFYVVIPATALEMGFLATSSILPGSKPFDISTVERSLIIEKAQNLLDPKRDHLIAQFARIGLYSRQLATQEIIQLFYIRYNPESIEGQQIAESNSYTTPLVKASIQETIMNSAPAMLTQTPVLANTNVQPEPVRADAVPSIPVADTAQVQPLPEIHIATQTTPLVDSPDSAQPAPVTEVANLVPSTTQQDSVPEVIFENAQIAPTVPAATVPQPAVQSVAVTPPLPTPPAQVMPTEVFSAPVPTPVPSVTPMMPPSVPSQPAPPASAPAPLASGTEQDIQADLNAAVQSLGVTPIAVTTPTATTTKPAANDDLPPLPEI